MNPAGADPAPNSLESDGESWRSRINALLQSVGGPTFLSWPVFWTSLTFVTLNGLFAQPEISWDRPAARIAVLFTSWVLVFAVLSAARATVLRTVDQVPRPLTVLVIFCVATFLRSITVAYAYERLGLVTSDHGSAVVISGTLVPLVALLVSTIGVAAFRQQARNAHAIDDQRQLLAHVQAQVQALTATGASRLAETARQQLTEQIGPLRTQPVEVSSRRLRAAAQDIARPLSHDLASSPDDFEPDPRPAFPYRVDWRSVIDDVTRSQPIPVFVLAIATTAVAYLPRVDYDNLAIPALRMVGAVLVVTGAGLLANVILSAVRPRCQRGWYLALITLALALIGALFRAFTLWALPNDLEPGDPRLQFFDWRLLLLVLLAFPLLGWMLILIKGVAESQRRTRQELRTLDAQVRWEVTRARNTQRQQRRELAGVLHGPVQAALNAGAIRMSAAAGGRADQEETLRQVAADVEAALDELDLDSSPPSDLGSTVERIQATWRGLCEVVVTVDDETRELLEHDDICTRSICDITTEACSNAVRHGGADMVEVTVTAVEPAAILLHILDNGDESTATPAQAGLGTEQLDDVALDWERTSVAAGCHLRVRLPLSAPDPSMPATPTTGPL